MTEEFGAMPVDSCNQGLRIKSLDGMTLPLGYCIITIRQAKRKAPY